MKRNFLSTGLTRKIVFIATGFMALLWFMIRVIPKPQRAAYPCQRVAFPVASTFIIWLLSSVASVRLFSRLSDLIKNSSGYKVVFVILAAVFFSMLSFIASPLMDGFAENRELSETTAVEALDFKQSEYYHPTVSIIRSMKSNAFDINQADINLMVRQAVSMAGGLEDLIHDGQVVVLKPNLVSTVSYADNKAVSKGPNGMVTDYRVIQAVVNMVRELNPNGKIYIMEGSAIGNSMSNMEAMGWTDVTDVDSVIGIEENSGDWYEYASPKLSAVTLPDSIALYPDQLKPNKSRPIYLNRIYYEADVVISLPVLKNHCYTGITGAVKNVGIGATPGKIYGNGKTMQNPTQREGGIEHDNRMRLHQWIHDFYACRPVDFAIMDGIQGSDQGPVGWGYSSWSKAQRNMRMILASRDPIALDAIEALIMGHDPQRIPHLVYLHNDGFGCADAVRIDVKGEYVEKIRTNFIINDSGLESKFSRFSCSYSPDSLFIRNDRLIFSFSDSTDLARIDVTVDGQPCTQPLFSNFSNIQVPLDSFDLSDSLIIITCWDKYLNTSVKKYVGSRPTGIGDYKQTSDFKLFPDPARDRINFTLNDDEISEMLVSVYAVDGKLELAKRIKLADKGRGTLDISALGSGYKLLVASTPARCFKARFLCVK